MGLVQLFSLVHNWMSFMDPSTSEQTSITITVPSKVVQAERVDKYLSQKANLSRSKVQHLLSLDLILVNGNPCKKNHKVKANDVFNILPEAEAPILNISPIEHSLEVVYEDNHLIVINKEPGMVVHPTKGDASEVTLVHILLHRYGKDGLSAGEDDQRPGIVHRLDKETSGLIIVCKTDECHKLMKDQFMARDSQLKKRYCALVLGKMKEESGTIDAPIMRHPGTNMGYKMITTSKGGDDKGKEALTIFKQTRSWQLQKHHFSLLDVEIQTGRTHQIRVHLASVHHPIVGDSLYGKQIPHGPSHLLLTSKHLEFSHPITKQLVSLSIELPTHFTQFIKYLDSNTKSDLILPAEDIDEFEIYESSSNGTSV